jgi:hypothetical protein
MSTKQSKPTPPFMQDDIGMGHEKIKADDVYWTGDDENIDAYELIRQSGYDPDGPLELLLLSVIAGHPDERSTAKRLIKALEALTATHPKGRPQDDDYDVLLQIAWKYHELKFAGHQRIKIAKLVRECLAARISKNSDPLARSEDGENSKVKRLKRKFQNGKDLLLARVTSEFDPDRMDLIRAVNKIAIGLEKLGVKLDRNAIRPRLRSGQNHP